uniref:Venom S1 protease 1 n=1 Tax=Oncocephalus sp. TaxID=2944721 RepID=A0AB38ZEH6_9HEMI
MRLVYCVSVAVLLGVCWAHPQGYLKAKFEEIDSAEHGLKAGPKSTNCSCGWTNKARIVGGRETLKNEFPFMCGIIEMAKKHLFCGASIITAYHALTASHCTYPNRGKKLGLLVGGHDVTKPDETTKIVEIVRTIEHEGYNPDTYHHDVAILVMSEGLKFTQHVGPVCLPAKGFNLIGQHVKVIGWGRLKNKGKTSTVLMKVNLRVIKTSECKKKYLRSIIEGNQICTFRKSKDSCQGDSGGPLIWIDPETNRFTQVAAVSYGKKCAMKTPAVNSDVAKYMQWIQQKIAETGLPGKTCAKIG